MKSKKLYYIMFFPSDWRNEPCLKFCSLAAKGLWIEMLCLMFQSSIHGHLCHPKKSEPLQIKDLVTLIGASEEEIRPLLAELEANGVCSRDDEIKTIYSRRMLRDQDKRNLGRQKTRKYRNKLRASLSGSSNGVTEESPVCVRTDQRLETRNHKPEARDQRLKAGDQSSEAYKPEGLNHLRPDSQTRKANLAGIFKGKSTGLTTNSVCDLPTFIQKGNLAGLEEDFCREEYGKLSLNGWCDSHGTAIGDLDAYIRGIARNRRREEDDGDPF